MELKKCTSCNLGVQEGATIFKCPKCGDEEIVRCSDCKRVGVRYKCKKCEFEGPN